MVTRGWAVVSGKLVQFEGITCVKVRGMLTKGDQVVVDGKVYTVTSQVRTVSRLTGTGPKFKGYSLWNVDWAKAGGFSW